MEEEREGMGSGWKGGRTGEDNDNARTSSRSNNGMLKRGQRSTGRRNNLQGDKQ